MWKTSFMEAHHSPGLERLVAGHFCKTREKARPAAEEEASRLAALASAYPEGAILEKRGDRFLERRRLVG